jgi:uncharacterized membrane protein
MKIYEMAIIAIVMGVISAFSTIETIPEGHAYLSMKLFGMDDNWWAFIADVAIYGVISFVVILVVVKAIKAIKASFRKTPTVQ